MSIVFDDLTPDLSFVPSQLLVVLFDYARVQFLQENSNVLAHYAAR